MPAFKDTVFLGIRPRLPDSLLPEHNATIAQNCDFAYGELRSTKDGFLLRNMSNAPKSIYTDDGLTFFTWTSDVNAVRSPLAKDTYNRMYYTGDSGFKMAIRTSTSINGGPPGSSYLVGVPKPTLAPVLTTSLPVINASTATFTFKFHYEYGGVKYQEQDIAPTLVSDLVRRFTPPAMSVMATYSDLGNFPTDGASGTVYKATDTGFFYTWNGSTYVQTSASASATPSAAFPVLRITAVSTVDASQLFDLYTDNSSFSGTGGLYALSMAKDSGASSFTATLTVGVKEADKEARAYVYTYVNIYDEEGPPSPPSIVTTSPLMNVSLVATKDSLAGYAPIKEIRVYRTPSGSTVADYFYALSISALTGGPSYAVTDSTKSQLLNEMLTSTNWYPPDQALVGLMSLPNGILCAWKGNELWFSEAYKPHAWPPQYIKPMPHTIVGGLPSGTGAVITTVTSPYLLAGASPDSMTTQRINVDQAGVSKWSLAVVDGMAMYATNDGLVVLNGVTGSLSQSAKFFTREVWRARYGAGLSTMRFSVWDGRLIVFSSAGAFTPFMIRLDEADGTMTDLPNFSASCAFVSALSDQCYYASGNGIYQFNGGSDLTAVWQSKEMVFPKPESFGALQSVFTGSWSIQFTALLSETPDPARRGTFTYGVWTMVVGSSAITMTATLVPGIKVLPIPGGFKSDRWAYKLTGSGRFRELRVAHSGRALASL